MLVCSGFVWPAVSLSRLVEKCERNGAQHSVGRLLRTEAMSAKGSKADMDGLRLECPYLAISGH
jgi:hypothetical protein